METLTNKLIDKALTEYEEVLDELNRPKKDLVMIAVCEQVKKSISDFLAAFLAEKGVLDIRKNDILHMQKECAKFDKAFETLHYESIAFLCEDASMVYTNELDNTRLNRYVDTMKKTKEMVFKALEG